MLRRIGLSAAIGVQRQEISDILKTSGRYAAATTNHDVKPFCTNNELFATGNKRATNAVSCCRMSANFYVLTFGRR